MKMDRGKAIDFAKAHWNTVCDDGVFWLTDQEVDVARKRRELGAPTSDGWDFRFLPDGLGREHAVFVRNTPGAAEKEVWPWEGLADCAHFLSRCLRAGGVTTASLSVPKLVHLLQLRDDTKTLAERVTKAQGQNVIDSDIFQPGDMLGYFNNNAATGDFGRTGYSHSTMYAGKFSGTGRITCHTKCRFPGLTPAAFSDAWHLDDTDYSYTFIHFSGDDAALTPATAKLLAGWWQMTGSPVVSGSPPVFQYIDVGGTAYFTTTKPRTAGARPAALDRAYWFDNGSSVTFVWRKTGTVDVWALPPASSGVDIKTNGMTPRLATRLFP